MSKILMNDVCELIGCAIFMVLVVISMILFCIATPDQVSAECEYLRTTIGE